MTTSVVTPTVTQQWLNGTRKRILLGTLAIGAGDYTTGGLALSLVGKHPAYLKTPDWVDVYDVAGYRYVYDVATGKLKIYTGVAATTSTLVAYVQPNVKGAAANTTNSGSADQNAAPTNSAYLMTLAAVGATFTYVEAAEIDVPRNVAIVYKNDSTGGPLNLYEGTNSIVITGTFRGAAQTETISWVSTAGNKAIADTKFRWVFGVKPFDSITDITMTQPGAATLSCSIGLGRLLGYPVDGNAGTSADFIKATVAGADVAIAAVSTTNKTVDLGVLADGNAVAIEYMQKTPGATADGEYAATALPAAITGGTIRFKAIIDRA